MAFSHLHKTFADDDHFAALNGFSSEIPPYAAPTLLRLLSCMSPLQVLLKKRLNLRRLSGAHFNPARSLLVRDTLQFGEAVRTKTGALATWGPAHATGRIPLDTYTVQHDDDDSVDWAQPNNHPITPAMFDALFQDALEMLKEKARLYVTDRVVGAEARYAQPVRTITDSALTALFTHTLFRPIAEDMNESLLNNRAFTLLVLPRDVLDTEKYRRILREENGRIIDHAILMDFERNMGIVIGTTYLGAVKKLLFTRMNHLLPVHGVLPLHCAAVEDHSGDTHLFLGLSGTGKTTLSSGPGLTMIGDDEHLWSDAGIANMEYGCYAKLFRLSEEKEPDIYHAVFNSNAGPLPIIENAMVLPDGCVDVNDARLTENSRAAYPLSSLPSVKPNARGAHPSTIIFLTADARGVLPPIAKLPVQQAMLWFLLGYTSKLAGTEMGVTTPQSTFSRFFGGAFMPRKSEDYLTLFQHFVSEHRPEIYLVNTGWTGGAYGIGKRMDITVTRRLVDAALAGQLKEVPYREDALFHLLVPRDCPGVDPRVLDPRTTWSDAREYDVVAKELAAEFGKKFDGLCRGEMLEILRGKCPGQ